MPGMLDFFSLGALLFDGLIEITSSSPVVVILRHLLRNRLELQGTLFAVQPLNFANGGSSEVYRAKLIQPDGSTVMVRGFPFAAAQFNHRF
jgi:hypothetical protein